MMKYSFNAQEMCIRVSVACHLVTTIQCHARQRAAHYHCTVSWQVVPPLLPAMSVVVLVALISHLINIFRNMVRGTNLRLKSVVS